MSPLPRWFRSTWVALLIAAVALSALGCTSADESQDIAVTDSAGAPAMSPTVEVPYGVSAEEAARGDGAESQNPADGDRMVIRTKTLRLEVDSTTDTLEDIRGLIKTHGGTIQDLQVATDTDEWLYRYDEYGYATGDGAALRGWVTVRVPAASFEPFVEDVIGLGEVRFQAEDSEDVTQQHVDLSARLANLRAEEERLRTFFDAAKDVKDMLAIETELNRVRQEIESLDAQVKYLERQAAMATITIELTEPRPVVRPSGEDWGFRDAITNGFRTAAGVLTFLIAAIIGSAPLWITGIIVFFIVRAIVRARARARGRVPVAGQDTPVQAAQEWASPTQAAPDDPSTRDDTPGA